LRRKYDAMRKRKSERKKRKKKNGLVRLRRKMLWTPELYG